MSNDHSQRGAIAATFLSMKRSTTWTLKSALALRFDAYHPQGLVRRGSDWWISTVDVENRRGYIVVADGDGVQLERIPVGDDLCYHPGGMDHDGSAFWIASSEYRPHSSTNVYRMEEGRAPEFRFAVADHVGAIARCGPDGDLVGWSWGSRTFNRWSIDGTLLSTRENPSHFVDYQDCQWIDSGHIVCGGVSELALADGPGWVGGVGLMEVTSLTMLLEVPCGHYSKPSGRVVTHNPMWVESVDGELALHLLPDDGVGSILTYTTPLVGQPTGD